ncbi:MAG: hypothetical protein KGZ30_00795 [Anaplasmataceae bacterium]|nr:hypothetical protein [Anaplasmataceae bacterium]
MEMWWHGIVKFFDRLEDRIRMYLSKRPILYTMIGGFGVVLFWRGVWITADEVPFLNGPVSIILSTLILLITGLFVSFFIGDRIILSGLKGEKKLVEKTASGVKTEAEILMELKEEVKQIEEEIGEIKEMHEK